MYGILRQVGRSISQQQHIRAMATPGASSGGGEQERPAGKRQNRLAKERSPYLLQHATNPVDWYPWGEEAFKKAVEENKLIFLSVGYSTCHWCHVMEKESFEDDKVAQVLNSNFINIKVDREERPDVDSVYMAFVTSVSGAGGWPMSVWLTPDLTPVYGGTYFPPASAYYGRPGFTTILHALANQWSSDEDKMRESSTAIVGVLARQSVLPKPGTGDVPSSVIHAKKCFQQLKRSYEPKYGGFGKEPKFPQPVKFNFLFAYYLFHPELKEAKEGLDMALHSLSMIARGGIHDHISQGFARYSTDNRWHVPHFEKMLYDQAQLLHSYLDAYLVTRNQEYADVARDIVQYVCRDLSHESGGFYSAEDADSLATPDSKHKKEGAFCVWTREEISSLLSGLTVKEGSDSPTLTELFCQHYSVAETGNVDPAKDPHDELKQQNVLMEHGSVEETAEEFEVTVGEVKAALSRARALLYDKRQARPRPHLDDKMLAAWNGMIISGIARAGAVLSEQQYVERAQRGVDFLTRHLIGENGRLHRTAYRGDDGGVTLGARPIEGFSDDYAWAIRAMLTLYDATLDQRHLITALSLQTVQDELFWDAEDGAYFSTQQDSALLFRMKDDYDGVEPSVSSVSAGNLLRLSRLLDKPELQDKCRAIMRVFAGNLNRGASALPELTSVQLMLDQPTSQVILSGEPSSSVMQELISVVHSFPQANRVLLAAPSDPSAPLYTHQPNLLRYRHKKPGDDTTTTAAASSSEPSSDSGQVLESAKAYVCHNFVCSLPITKPEQLRENLNKAFRPQQAAAAE